MTRIFDFRTKNKGNQNQTYGYDNIPKISRFIAILHSNVVARGIVNYLESRKPRIYSVAGQHPCEYTEKKHIFSSQQNIIPVGRCSLHMQCISRTVHTFGLQRIVSLIFLSRFIRITHFCVLTVRGWILLIQHVSCERDASKQVRKRETIQKREKTQQSWLSNANWEWDGYNPVFIWPLEEVPTTARCVDEHQRETQRTYIKSFTLHFLVFFHVIRACWSDIERLENFYTSFIYLRIGKSHRLLILSLTEALNSPVWIYWKPERSYPDH